MSDWFSFERAAKALDKRKWWWGSSAADYKYIVVRIDTRDNHCTVTFENRDGKVFADSIEKFEAVMEYLDQNQGKSFTFQDMRSAILRKAT